tara:strand:+ start:63 stop:317 length:255 start_codon:yes stop_codon:yes gene_type:complete
MDKLKVRCRSCGKELEGHSGKTYSCGCSNMTTITGNKVSANDMSEVVMLNSSKKHSKSVLKPEDIEWQEQRRQRKVRKLDFEIR